MDRLARWLVIAVCLCVGGRAMAQTVTPAYREAYDEGVEAYQLGELERARAALEKARSIQPELPGTYRWLAAVAKAQKRWEDCLAAAEEYLTRSKGGRYVDSVRKLHADCRDALGRPRFDGDLTRGGAIAVTSNVEGASVRINGLKYGATPLLPRPVAAGPSDVTVEAPGYLPKTVSVDIVEGIVKDVHVDLERDPNAARAGSPRRPRADEVRVGWVSFAVGVPGATVTVDGEPARADAKGRVARPPGVYAVEVRAAGFEPWRRRVRFVRGQERTVAVTLRRSAERARYRRRGFISLGVAAIATGAGVVFSFREQSAREEAQDIWDTETRRPPGVDTSFVPVRTRADLEDAVDRAQTWRAASLASYGVAAAALGVSVYFFVKERPAEREGYPLPMAVVPLLDGDGGLAGAAAAYTAEVDW